MNIKFDNIFLADENIDEWQGITDLMVEILDVSAGFITKIEDSRIRILLASSREKIPIEDGEVLDLMEVYCQEVVRRHDMVEIADGRKIDEWQDSRELEMGFVSYLGLPVYLPDEDKLFGTICVVDTRPRDYQDRDKNLLKELKKLVESRLDNIIMNRELRQQLAIAQYILTMQVDITERKKKEKELEVQNYKIKKLHEVAFELEKVKTREKVCQKTVEAAESLLDFNFCNVRLLEDEMLVNKAVSSEVDVQLDPRSVNENSISSKTYRQGESLLIQNVEKCSEADPVKNSYSSGISIPIGDFGVFQAISTEKAAYSEKDLELAELLVYHTTAALKRIYSQEKLKFKSFHDELTGLYNRRFIREEMKRLDTERQLPLSIILGDINGLKIINDSLGHDKGDELIIKVAKILQEIIRDEDILARYGGDEFAILLPQTSREEVDVIISRIKKSCEQTEADKLPVSLGIGAATKENVNQDMENVLAGADNNMYRDKLAYKKKSEDRIIRSLQKVLADKSCETEEHRQRMKKVAADFEEKLRLSASEQGRLNLLADLHDIGLSSVSEVILRKSGCLNSEEWEEIKKHAERGFKICSASKSYAAIAEEVLAHHERWDGKGYPRGLQGKEIPLLARIIAIVDAYLAMVNQRPYSEAVNSQEALQEIKDCAGTQFDPRLADKFLEMME